MDQRVSSGTENGSDTLPIETARQVAHRAIHCANSAHLVMGYKRLHAETENPEHVEEFASLRPMDAPKREVLLSWDAELNTASAARVSEITTAAIAAETRYKQATQQMSDLWKRLEQQART